MSHPSWVCGLKLSIRCSLSARRRSHPSWVCGLKRINDVVFGRDGKVTPFVGVWIETSEGSSASPRQPVTPFVGVWIETRIETGRLQKVSGVTPFVGVWIETRRHQAEVREE